MDKKGPGGGGLLALGFHATMDAAVPHQHQHGRRQTSVAEVDFFSGDKKKEAESDRTTIKEEDTCLQLLPTAGNNIDEGDDDDTKNATTEVRHTVRPSFFSYIRGINGRANILIQSRMIDRCSWRR
jgi:hypothetical protein